MFDKDAKQFSKRSIAFSTPDAEATGPPPVKNPNFHLSLTPSRNVNSEWAMDLNVDHTMTKLLTLHRTTLSEEETLINQT